MERLKDVRIRMAQLEHSYNNTEMSGRRTALATEYESQMANQKRLIRELGTCMDGAITMVTFRLGDQPKPIQKWFVGEKTEVHKYLRALATLTQREVYIIQSYQINTETQWPG